MENDPLKHVYTAVEAEERYNLKPGTIRASCVRGRLKSYIGKGVKQSGKTWLITDEIMQKVYKNKENTKEENKMTLEELKKMVAENIVISEENGVYYADVVEDNGDEDRLTQSVNLDDLHQQLKDFGQIK